MVGREAGGEDEGPGEGRVIWVAFSWPDDISVTFELGVRKRTQPCVWVLGPEGQRRGLGWHGCGAAGLRGPAEWLGPASMGPDLPGAEDVPRGEPAGPAADAETMVHLQGCLPGGTRCSSSVSLQHEKAIGDGGEGSSAVVTCVVCPINKGRGSLQLPSPRCQALGEVCRKQDLTQFSKQPDKLGIMAPFGDEVIESQGGT